MAKKKRTIEEPIPLQLIRDIRKINTGYGDIFALVDQYRDILMQSGMSWESNCYLPLTAYVELVGRFGWQNIGINVEDLFHLAAWRRYSQVYSFDPTLVAELMESDSSDVVTDALQNIPYDSFYVDTQGAVEGLRGFFCCRNCQIFNGNESVSTANSGEFLNSLHLMFLLDSGDVLGFPVANISGMTISQSRERYASLLEEAISANGSHLKSKVAADEYMNQINNLVENYTNPAIQILLYLCSMNKDIVENPEQKKIYKKSEHHVDRLSSVQKWDVGYRIGQVIRQAKANSESKERTISQTSKKRPHTRRAHFHHFWIGKRDSAERKLVVKWIAPMFINADGDVPAVVNFVEV